MSRQNLQLQRPALGMRFVNILTRLILAPLIGVSTFAILLCAALVAWVGFGHLNLSPVLPYLEPYANRWIADQTG